MEKLKMITWLQHLLENDNTKIMYFLTIILAFSMIDLLIENNSEELENMYKDNSLNDDLKKKQTNDLLEENNTLLSEKIELTNAEKD